MILSPISISTELSKSNLVFKNKENKEKKSFLSQDASFALIDILSCCYLWDEFFVRADEVVEKPKKPVTKSGKIKNAIAVALLLAFMVRILMAVDKGIKQKSRKPANKIDFNT